jgi:ribose transport system ATP-binding protein
VSPPRDAEASVTDRTSLLSIQGLSKSFGPTVALAGMNLEARAGEVHAVLGENGAGKSTLMAVLGGATSPDRGSIVLSGRPFVPRSPREAQAAGIARVHQELSLCSHLSVAQNVMLGREPTRHGLIDESRLYDEAAKALDAAAGRARRDAIGLGTRVADLAPAEKQLVEVARALVGQGAGHPCRVLILDEPTSSLGRGEVSVLFGRIRSLREEGLLILYVSHFLEEVLEIADRFTVLRDGSTVATGEVRDTSLSELVSHMTGKSVDRLFPRTKRVAGDIAMEVHEVAGDRLPVRASFELRCGEVLGLAGLVGSGRTELLRVLFGLDPANGGTIQALGRAGQASPEERLRTGVGMLSEDRKREGLALSMSVADNVTLSKLPVIVRSAVQRSAAERWTLALGVKCPDVSVPVRDLSGGNQQKIALGRLLHQDSEVLLLDQPTRGIDVGAKADIYDLVDRLASQGKAIVLVSDDLSELLGVSDRIAVMVRGVLGAARPVGDWTEASLLAEAVGAKAVGAAS